MSESINIFQIITAAQKKIQVNILAHENSADNITYIKQRDQKS